MFRFGLTKKQNKQKKTPKTNESLARAYFRNQLIAKICIFTSKELSTL